MAFLGRKALRVAAGATVALLALALLLIALRPPELLRAGAGYSAKVVCSNVFLAHRDERAVLEADVQAPGHPLLRLVRVSVDRQRGRVRASVGGLVDAVAVFRPGTGCAVVPDGDIAAAERVRFDAPAWPAAPAATPWPQGEEAQLDAAVQALAADEALAGPGARAVLVVHDGRLVAERYGPGFDRGVRLLGWSMTKSVNAVLVGLLVGDGRLRLDQDGLLGAPVSDDPRRRIRLADLLAMSSGLRFEENYGAVSDVTRMLFLEPDMARFAAAQPLLYPPGEHWSYSSGSAVLLAAIWQRAAGADAWLLPSRRLFGPLGMRSAVLEADARGNFVGSSYLYATAQDWARFAQFLLQDGIWEGRRLLPESWVAMMRTPAPASRGAYGQGQVWLDLDLQQARRGTEALPPDVFWLSGHDGQSVAIVPSRRLVLVRMGLTPAATGYRPRPLLARLIAAFDAPAPRRATPGGS